MERCLFDLKLNCICYLTNTRARTHARTHTLTIYYYGLCRSSLIMGAYPGCPVCSIVAASLVAVETDVGETISAAKSRLCVVSGLLELLHSFLRALFPTSAFISFSSPDLRCWFSASPPHAVGCKVLPGPSVDDECFHVSLADILVAQLWAAFGSPSRYKLSIENVFWDAAILHVVDVTTANTACAEQREHAWKVGSGQDLGIGHSVLPDMPRIRRMILRWKKLSLFSCLVGPPRWPSGKASAS